MILRTTICLNTLFVLATAGVGPAWAVPIKATAFMYQYLGDTYENSNPKLTGIGPGTGGAPNFIADELGPGGATAGIVTGLPTSGVDAKTLSVNGSALQFQSPVATGGNYYHFANSGFPWNSWEANTIPYTVEFRLKIGDDGPENTPENFPDGNRGSFGVYLGRKTSGGTASANRDLDMGIGEDFVYIGSTMIATADNTDGFHDFRIAMPSSSANTVVMRDGAVIFTGNPSGSSNYLAYFGDGSGTIGGATATLDYFAFHPQVAYVDPLDYEASVTAIPEPNSLLLAFLGAITALACSRVRKR